jgi:hypothetical protein
MGVEIRTTSLKQKERNLARLECLELMEVYMSPGSVN